MINQSQNTITLNKTLPCFRDTFFTEGDVIIPDIKPDVETVLYVDALPVIDNYIVNSGQITISGNTEFNILYVAEDLPNEIIRISTSIPFKNSFAVSNLTPESFVEIKINPEKISSLILNGRKLSISAELNTIIKTSNKEEINYIEEIENTDTIKQLKTSKTLPVFITSAKNTTTVKDTSMLETSKPTIKEILKYKSEIENIETVNSDGKVLLKGDISIKIYYIAPSSNEINLFTPTLPFSTFIDIKDIKETDLIDVTSQIKNLSIKLLPDSDDLMRIIEFEAIIETNLKVFREKEINIIDDIYSLESDLLPEKEEVEYEIITKPLSEDVILRGVISIPEDEHIKILESVGRIKTLNIENNMLTGIIDVTVIYCVTSTGKINSVSLDMPMEHILTEKIEIIKNSKIKDIEVTNIGGEKYDVKIVLEISGKEYKKESLFVLHNLIEMEKPAQKNNGLTIYFVKQGDTLWKIAKKFHTSIENIVEINELTNQDNIEIGKALVIA